MKEIEITASYKKFICTNDDIITDNGSIIRLDTQKFFKNARYGMCRPIISKTEFKRLLKLGILEKSSEDNYMTKYKFILDEE